MRKRENICWGWWGQFSLRWQTAKNKIVKKWAGPGISIGRFGNKYALVHFRGSYFEVDLDDMRAADSLFGIIGFDGTLTLQIPHTKFPNTLPTGFENSCFLNKNTQRILAW